MLFLQNNLPLHISPPGTSHSTLHACSHQQCLFLQSQSSERTPPPKPPHNRNLSELLNEYLCPFSQNPKVISAEWLGFWHLLHVRHIQIALFAYLHFTFTRWDIVILCSQVGKLSLQGMKWLAQSHRVNERQNLALNLDWGQVQCTGSYPAARVDILSRILLITMYMTTIHFCGYLYYQVLNPERTCHFHVCMPDTRGGNSKIDINIFEAIHSRLRGTCLFLNPPFSLMVWWACCMTLWI